MITIIPDSFFERFIECLACAGHANSELCVYSVWVEREKEGESGHHLSSYVRSLDEFSLCR